MTKGDICWIQIVWYWQNQNFKHLRVQFVVVLQQLFLAINFQVTLSHLQCVYVCIWIIGQNAKGPTWSCYSVKWQILLLLKNEVKTVSNLKKSFRNFSEKMNENVKWNELSLFDVIISLRSGHGDNQWSKLGRGSI